MIIGQNGVILTEAGLLLAEQGRQISEDLKTPVILSTGLKKRARQRSG